VSHVDLRIENRIARLTLQRPGGDAFSTEMLTQFRAALERSCTEANILVIAAAGEDFSVGRDRQEPKGGGTPFDAFKLITEVNTALAAFPGVAVALARGRAFGFAVGLIMRCDIAIASEDARFALDEVKLGISPMFIMSEILEHLSPKRALDIVLSSREFGAVEARDMGLVSRVVPAARLEASGEELMGELSGRDPAVLVASKRYLGEVAQLPPAARAAYALVEQTRFAEKR
jgi:enoyl-CoA hydratase/carnithine racemase